MLLLAVAGCARSEPAIVERIDLIAELPYTIAGCARSRLDLASPDVAGARLAGWAPIAAPHDDAVAWVDERRAELRLCLDAPRARTMQLRARALPGDPRRRHGGLPVLLRLNGQRVGVLRIGPDTETFAVALPAGAQRLGDNLLELEHPLLRERRRDATASLPEGAVGYEWLEIVDAEGGADRGDRATVEGDTLVLPPGAAVEYFVRLPARARLRLATAARDDARLRVRMRRDGAAAHEIADVAVRAGERVSHDLALDGADEEIVALSLASTSSGEIRLGVPRIDGAPPSVRGGEKSASSPAPVPGSAPNVLLYVIDTLRADHLGSYGYDLPTTPHLDALAREGLLFERVVAQSSWTRPAVASLLTGLDPEAHGATGLRRGLRTDVATLAGMLAGHGYETAAFVTNLNVSEAFGFARDFATFEYLPEDAARESLHVLSDQLGRAVARWLAARDPGRPFFLYVHASDPHAPYTAGADLRARFRRDGADASVLDPRALRDKLEREPGALTRDEVRELVAAYDAEIAFNDASVGALVEELARLGLRDSTVLVVTADHGEEFRDHGGLQHGHTLYEELIRVPLIVRLPAGERAGERRGELARQIDLAPTVLDAIGATLPAHLPGRSLLAAAPAGARALEATSHTRLARRDLAARVGDAWKVVRSLGGPSGGEQTFDLVADPHERRDAGAEHAVLTGYAMQSIRRAARTAAAPEAHRPPPVDADTERRLRALGYAE